MSICEQTRQAKTGEQETHPVPAQLPANPIKESTPS
jgi:hypothetical protein